jgi:metallo-beta-lactamase family protein
MLIQVCGAARTVTGSCVLVEAADSLFLVDCGMHQGGEKGEALNFQRFVFGPEELDFVLLTHAHIDHSGRLPRLVKQGFSGPIYATPATCDLAEIMLLDSAYIQEMEAEWRTRKAKRAGRRGVEALYTEEDARKAISLLKPVAYNAPTELAPGVTVQFHDAGHILGSAFLEVWLEEDGERTKVLFSGDVGQPDRPIIRDPQIVETADFLIMESTYGDRLHESNGAPEDQLAEILEQAKRTGGNVIIPAFAVGRTQEVVYYLRQIMDERGLDMSIYVDSPMASRATEVYRRHREIFDEEAWKLVGEPGGIFDYPGLHYTASADESRALNEKKGIVIISASGMADAGRIRHHLKHNLWRPEAHVVIVGYQAEGSLGRRLLDGAETVRIFGEEIAVKAHIHDITGLSAHADQEQLLEWASHIKGLRLVILTHGEPQAALKLKSLLEERLHFTVAVANMNEVFDLRKAPRSRVVRGDTPSLGR